MNDILQPVLHDPLTPGTQVIYIPMHIRNRIEDQDGNISQEKAVKEIAYPNGAQCGFVTSSNADTAFVRYFYPDGELRNRANSEGTYRRDLFYLEFTSLHVITGLLTLIKLDKL